MPAQAQDNSILKHFGYMIINYGQGAGDEWTHGIIDKSAVYGMFYEDIVGCGMGGENIPELHARKPRTGWWDENSKFPTIENTGADDEPFFLYTKLYLGDVRGAFDDPSCWYKNNNGAWVYEGCWHYAPPIITDYD